MDILDIISFIIAGLLALVAVYILLVGIERKNMVAVAISITSLILAALVLYDIFRPRGDIW